MSERDEGRSDEVETEGREVLAGADRERERQRRDEEHARHDPRCALSHLTRRVEVRLPEDEDQQQDQERQPVRLLVPEQAPEDRLRIEEERTEGKRREQPEHEPGDVDRHERERASDATRNRLQRCRREEVRPRRTNVLDLVRRPSRAPAQNRLSHAAIVPP